MSHVDVKSGTRIDPSGDGEYFRAEVALTVETAQGTNVVVYLAAHLARSIGTDMITAAAHAEIDTALRRIGERTGLDTDAVLAEIKAEVAP